MTSSIQDFAVRLTQALLDEAELLAERNGVSASDWDEYRRTAGKVLGLRRAADAVTEILQTYREDGDN
jgi:hypothetical protein